MNPSMRRRLAPSALFLLAAPAVAAAQAQRGATSVPDGPLVRQALEYAARTEPQTIEDQVALCQIEAPPFKEARRAQEYRARMRALGLVNTRIDSEGNAIGELPGSDPRASSVLISGHLDTVFPEGTDVRVRREGTVLHGPGIGDDCRGLAVVLAVARTMRESGLRPRGTVYFVGTVGEEGAGNLRGVRHLLQNELKGKVGYFLSVDGAGYDITKDAVASHRYRVSYAGPGGHSYGAFGMPNPIHALGRAIAKVSELQVPSSPKVTFNVGVVGGGTSVNSIADRASMDVDMRSQDQAALRALDERFQAAIRAALAEENARWRSPVKLTLHVDTIGIRPGGGQPESAAIVQAGLQAARALGVTSRTTASSTDANVPISLGIPAVTIDGGGSGRGAHSLQESYDTRDSHKGTQWALLYILTLAGVR